MIFFNFIGDLYYSFLCAKFVAVEPCTLLTLRNAKKTTPHDQNDIGFSPQYPSPGPNTLPFPWYMYKTIAQNTMCRFKGKQALLQI